MAVGTLPPTIHVDELLMRPVEESDREPYRTILNTDDSIARWTTIPYPYGDADFDAFLNDPGENSYVIEWDGQVAGGIGIRIDHDAQTALIGYWLAPEARGHGVISRAAASLCEHAFDIGVQRIVAEVILGNLTSGAVLDRLGFTLEGVARSVHAPSCGLEGGRIDEQIWSLLPGELVK